MITRLAAAVTVALHTLADRARALRAAPEAGYTTETIVVTAALASIAIAALAIFHDKIIAAFNALTL